MAVIAVLAISLSLVANWVASENIIGLTGEVACSHAVPAILLDPLGAAVCLGVLGCLLSPHVGVHSTMSDVMIQRFGGTVGGLAAALSVLGSILWAGAQYKAILTLSSSLKICPPELLEPIVAVGLLLWSVLGGLMADIWLDATSMIIVAPTMIAFAVMAWTRTPASAFQAEKDHAWSVAPSLAANKFAIGLLGNLFTEELAGRVLSAGTSRQALLACMIASLLFVIIGLSPAMIGVWASSAGLLDAEGLCESQDQVIGMALQKLLPQQLVGKEHILLGILILESLNTVDTSILMCARVMACQARRLQLQAAWVDHAMIVLSLGLIISVSKMGDNVWELAEGATSAVGAPLALLCILIPLGRNDRLAAGWGAIMAQCCFLHLEGDMAFSSALILGGAIYAGIILVT